jgi:hypothetical protein
VAIKTYVREFKIGIFAFCEIKQQKRLQVATYSSKMKGSFKTHNLLGYAYEGKHFQNKDCMARQGSTYNL